MKQKYREYSFWLSLVSAILLAAQAILVIFGVELTEILMDKILYATNAVLAVFVILGYVTRTVDKEKKLDE